MKKIIKYNNTENVDEIQKIKNSQQIFFENRGFQEEMRGKALLTSELELLK